MALRPLLHRLPIVTHTRDVEVRRRGFPSLDPVIQHESRITIAVQVDQCSEIRHLQAYNVPLQFLSQDFYAVVYSSVPFLRILVVAGLLIRI